ncbi:MAG: hypothetical protein GC159_18475 [Phycisphaera sp.]|nr:hypothetical protein [Phycisphaera sp.]
MNRLLRRRCVGCLVALLLAGPAVVRAEDYVVHTWKKVHLTPTFYAEGGNYGDFNKDGKVDVEAGPYWYAGPEFTERHEIYPAKEFPPGSYSDNFFSYGYDINGDGWDDIVVIGFPGKETFWYENPKGKDEHWQRHLAVKSTDNESPMFKDLTGDGKPELIFHTGGVLGYATPDWADPTKEWTFHPIAEKAGYQRFTHGIGIGDVNGDGRMDFLMSNGWWEQPAKLDGDPLWTKHDTHFGGGGSQMYAYDVDGDGDNDVVCSLQAHAYGFAWFENLDGKGGSFKQHTVIDDKPEHSPYGLVISQMHAVDMVDMDGDGVMDFVTGKRWWAHNGHDPGTAMPAVVVWFKVVPGKKSGEAEFIPYEIDNDSGVGTQVTATDVNGDGLPDIVVGNKKGTFIHLHSTKKVDKATYEAAQPKKQDPGKAADASAPASGATGGLPASASAHDKTLADKPPVAPQAGRVMKGDPIAGDVLSKGELPVGDDGKPLNTDFETGDLRDWTASGEAFKGQPYRGEIDQHRKFGQGRTARHQGEYWIGGYEVLEDTPTGTLTSKPFKVTQPWASMRVAGGNHPETRVEIADAKSGKVWFSVSGNNSETLEPVLADLSKHVGDSAIIRIVDEHTGGWGHINFDDFRLFAKRPSVEGAVATAPKVPPKPAEPQATGMTAREAAKAMTLPDGFKVNVIAAEPRVHQPIAMTIDERGRLWIAEAYAYPKRQPEGEGKDRILIFEDTDHDGRFETQKVFTEGLNLISGLEVGYGGVWVGAAPYLLFIPDKNHDDKPDGEPQVLLDGFNYNDTHEVLNSFIWGPDGWLYGCHGVFNQSKVGRPGTPDDQRVPFNAGVWRYHPTKHVFEGFAWGTSNPWGVDFNDYGQAFVTACVIPHFYHMIEGGRYQRQAGKHFNANVYDDIKTIADHLHYTGNIKDHAWWGRNTAVHDNGTDAAGGGHAHCGAMVYLGDSFPAEYRNKVFMFNVHGNRMNMDVPDPHGSGYVGRHGDDFMKANDPWFRGVSMKYGPSGSVYFIDWYDKQACHRGDPNIWDRTNGRIYRISYGPHKPADVNLGAMSDAELVKLMMSPNDWYVRTARRLLAERAADGKPISDELAAQLAKTALSLNDDAPQRLRALWALHVTRGVSDDLTLELLNMGGGCCEYLRAWAIQLALEDGAASEAIVSKMADLAANDDSQVVRLYLASALQRLPLDQRWAIATALIQHPEDAEDHNLPLMYWYGIEALVPTDKTKATMLLAKTKVPLLRQYIARRMAAK